MLEWFEKIWNKRSSGVADDTTFLDTKDIGELGHFARSMDDPIEKCPIESSQDDLNYSKMGWPEKGLGSEDAARIWIRVAREKGMELDDLAEALIAVQSEELLTKKAKKRARASEQGVEQFTGDEHRRFDPFETPRSVAFRHGQAQRLLESVGELGSGEDARFAPKGQIVVIVNGNHGFLLAHRADGFESMFARGGRRAHSGPRWASGSRSGDGPKANADATQSSHGQGACVPRRHEGGGALSRGGMEGVHRIKREK